MSRMRALLLRRIVAPEMIALSVVEMVLTFTLALVLLTPATGGMTSSVHPAVACAVTVAVIGFAVGLYRPQIFLRAQSILLNTVVSALLSFPAVWVVSKLLGVSSYWPVGYDPLRPIKIVAIWSAGVIAIRFLFLAAARCDLFVHRVAVIGTGESPAVASILRATRRGFLDVKLCRPERAAASRLAAEKVRTLIFANDVDASVVPAIHEQYIRHGITVQTQSEFLERHLRRIDVSTVSDEWITGLRSIRVNPASAYVTRGLDIVTSLVLLLATLPIITLVAALIKLDSRGPVLYRQERVGLKNVPFTVLKFRSMATNAEVAGPSWAQHRDPRVTRVGSFMRKTRIDELPQLVNILRGEMSIIGPRPERPHFVKQLAQVIPHFDERALVKPGLTGWAQVNYPYGASIEDARAKLSFDLYYVKHRSFVLDLTILLSTVRVILFQEGAR